MKRMVHWMTWLGLCCLVSSAWAEPATSKASESGRPQIAVFNLNGPLLEKPPEISFNFNMESRRSLQDMLGRFRQAAKDDNLKAVVLTFEEPTIGWAQMQELRAGIKRLRDAHKDVYCYMEAASAGTYQLATAASRICMAPAGELDLTGLYVESTYIKGLLDKIGVEADIEHVGAYKGAGEPLMRTSPSPEAKEMLEWLIGDLFDQMVETIAQGRQMTPDEVRALIDRGPFNAPEAVKAQLIDEVVDADAFAQSLRERHGLRAELVHDYGAKQGTEIDFSNPFAFFKLLGQRASKSKKESKAAVAVVHVDGMILTGRTEPGLFSDSDSTGSTSFRRVLSEVREDDTIKAVVLRIDSPGGSALASDIMWRSVRLLADTKPVVISMGNVAASGGYYVSVGAPTIFADPGTITGSIGVVGGKVVTKGLWDWVGVSFHELSFGQNADLLNTNRKFDDHQRAIVRKQMEYVYGLFTDRVRQGRHRRLTQELDQIAGGRVFTGKQALALGLVDRLGGFDDAIAFAASEAHVSDYQIRTLPEPKDLFELLIQGLMGEEDEEGSDKAVQVPWLQQLTEKSAGGEMLQALRQADPRRAAAVFRVLRWMGLLQNESALMVMPNELVIR